jgi:hypothetical protein
MEPEKPGRSGGLRRVRRMSNWTAVALIAGTAATTGYFARASVGHTSPQAAASQAGGTGTGAQGTHKACVTVPVATSGGSGVTAQAPVTRACGTARNGSPVVIYVNRPTAGQDS